MALGGFNVGFVFSAVDVMSGPMIRMRREMGRLEGQATKSANKMTGAFTSLGLGVGALVGSAALLIPAFSLAKQAGNFELEMKRVQLAMGASKGEMGDLRQETDRLARDLAIDPKDTVLGFQELARAGLGTSAAMKIMAPAAQLAAASFGQLTTAQTTGLGIQAMRAFGVESQNVGKSLDQMAKIAIITRTEFKDLPLAIGIVSRGAQRMSQSLESSLVSFGLVRNIIPTVERAATSVARSMENLASKEKRAIFERTLGVKVVDKQTGKFRDMLDILEESIPAFEKLQEAERAELSEKVFGNKASSFFLAAMEQLRNGIETNTGETLKGAEALAFYRDNMENAGGLTKLMAEEQLKTFGGQLQLTSSRLKALKLTLGEAFAATTRDSVERLTNFMETLNKRIEQMPEGRLRAITDNIVRVGVALGAVGGLLTAASGIGFLSVGLKAAAGPLKAFAKFLPGVGLSSLVFAGAALAVKENVLGSGDAFNSLTSSLKETVGVLVDLGKVAMEGFGQGFKEGLFAVGAALQFTLGVFRGLAGVLGFSVDLLKDNEGVVRFLGRAIGFTTAAMVAWKVAVIGGRVAMTTALVTRKLFLLATQRQARASLQAAAADKIRARGMMTFDKIQKSTMLSSLGANRALGGAVRSATLFGSRAVGMLGALAGPVGMLATVGLLAASFIDLGAGIDEAREKADSLIDTQRNLRLEAIRGIEFRQKAERIGQRIEDLNKQITAQQEEIASKRSTLETFGFALGPRGREARQREITRMEDQLSTLQSASAGQFERLRGLRSSDALQRINQTAGNTAAVAAAGLQSGGGNRSLEQFMQTLLTELQKVPENQAKETRKALQDMGIFVDGEKVGELAAAGKQRALASAGVPVGEIT